MPFRFLMKLPYSIILWQNNIIENSFSHSGMKLTLIIIKNHKRNLSQLPYVHSCAKLSPHFYKNFFKGSDVKNDNFAVFLWIKVHFLWKDLNLGVDKKICTNYSLFLPCFSCVIFANFLSPPKFYVFSCKKWTLIIFHFTFPFVANAA